MPADARADDTREVTDPVVRAALRAFSRASPNRFRDLGVVAARQFADLRLPGRAVDQVDDRTIPGGDGQDMRVRTYRHGTESDRAMIVYFHGGGWTVGGLDSSDAFCRAVARESRAVVASVEYRLAPEHRFPAAAQDAFAAIRWASDVADELGSTRRRLVVAGDSAGATLAAGCCIAARDRGGPQIALQILAYPGVDGRDDRASMREFRDAPFLDAGDVRWFRAQYLGAGSPPRGVDSSWPIESDPEGLPPALILLAENDPLRDSGRAYAEHLAAGGTAVELHQYPGLFHGFLTLTPEARLAREALASMSSRIGELD